MCEQDRHLRKVGQAGAAAEKSLTPPQESQRFGGKESELQYRE